MELTPDICRAGPSQRSASPLPPEKRSSRGSGTNAGNVKIVQWAFSSIALTTLPLSSIPERPAPPTSSMPISCQSNRGTACLCGQLAGPIHGNIDHVTFADCRQGAITASDNGLQSWLSDLTLSNIDAGSAALLLAEFAYTYSGRVTANSYSGSALGQLPSSGTQVPFSGAS
jgi:hypothetical protein